MFSQKQKLEVGVIDTAESIIFSDGKRPYKGLTCLYPQPDGKTTMPTFVIPTARWEDYPIAYLCYAHSQMGSMLVEAVG